MCLCVLGEGEFWVKKNSIQSCPLSKNLDDSHSLPCWGTCFLCGLIQACRSWLRQRLLHPTSHPAASPKGLHQRSDHCCMLGIHTDTHICDSYLQILGVCLCSHSGLRANIQSTQPLTQAERETGVCLYSLFRLLAFFIWMASQIKSNIRIEALEWVNRITLHLFELLLKDYIIEISTVKTEISMKINLEWLSYWQVKTKSHTIQTCS